MPVLFGRTVPDTGCFECSTAAGLFFALSSHIVTGRRPLYRRRRRTAVLPLTKRQREILDYLNEFIQRHGYAPSLEEIGRQFSLSSLATVHKDLTNPPAKGRTKRAWNRSRSVELVPTRSGGRAVELPMLGYVAAGVPVRGPSADGGLTAAPG